MKLKNNIINMMGVLMLLVFVSACTTAGKSSHHHHVPEYSGKCANSLVHGKHDVKGKPEINVTYKGKTYYFSSDDMRDHFLSEIKSNVKKADKNWKSSSLMDRK